MYLHTFHNLFQSKPILSATILSILFAGLSIFCGNLGHIFGYSPILFVTIFNAISVVGLIWGLWRFNCLKNVSQINLCPRAIIFTTLWLIPVLYSLWLSPSVLSKHDMVNIFQIVLSSMNNELFYRGFILILLVRTLLPKNRPMAYIVLVTAVMSALMHLYVLATPAPFIYVLYQIIWATMFAMTAVYAMLLWRNIWIIIILHSLTSLYAGFNEPILGIPAMYISLLWFSILSIIGRVIVRDNDLQLLKG